MTKKLTPAASHETANVSAETEACMANAKPANFDFSLKDLDGKSVALSSYKGKVVLLNFWATWCGPCKAEIPGFVELQVKHRGDAVTPWAVATTSAANAKCVRLTFLVHYHRIINQKLL
jgi:thiol-disulfide isomerase/thioredoxin